MNTDNKPDDSFFSTGMQAYNEGRLEEAEHLFRRSLSASPDNSFCLRILGEICYRTGRKDQAVDFLIRAVAHDPANPSLHFNLASLFSQLNRFDEALGSYLKAASQTREKSFLAQIYYNIANVYKSAASPGDAVAYLERCLELLPGNYDAHKNLGDTALDLHDYAKAERHLNEALRAKPGDCETLNSLGTLYHSQGRLDEAIALYTQALKARPDHPNTNYNLGLAFREQGRLSEALRHLTLARQGDPGNIYILDNLVYLKERLCDWDGLAELKNLLHSHTSHALQNGTPVLETALSAVNRYDDEAYCSAIASSWGSVIAGRVPRNRQPFSFAGKRPGEKIVIGYLSSDFHDHPTSHLIAGLFGCHNRERFAIHCYSYGPDDKSGYRKKIRNECDRFVDISSESDAKAADLIHGNKVDILVDLKGFTFNSRMEILVYRPAPVQVSYLGYPGTCGAEFHDYIIADPVVIPKENAPCFHEKIVRLPHCYQVNDNQQVIGPPPGNRGDFGLPADGFVYCSFNVSHKIDPIMFQTWMRILQKVEGSVLWLLSYDRMTEDNLGRAAEKLGVSARRLLFARRLPKHEHLARMGLADLALDTRIYNGHTTTSDALWAGLPVLTKKGRHFASRVAASILQAIDLPELITGGLEEYEDLAVDLGRNPGKALQIKQKLKENRLRAPLFDTLLFTRHLEQAYQQMWDIFLAGEKPRHFDIGRDRRS